MTLFCFLGNVPFDDEPLTFDYETLVLIIHELLNSSFLHTIYS